MKGEGLQIVRLEGDDAVYSVESKQEISFFREIEK